MRIGALTSQAARLILLTLVLAGCSGPTSSPTPAPMASPTARINSLARLEPALELAANSFERVAEVEVEPPLQGYSYLVNGQQLIALEAVDAAEEQQISASLAAFAQELSSATRYWRSEDLGVFYTGDDGGVILLLSGLLGDAQTLQSPAQDEPYPPAVLASIQHISEEASLNPSTIQVESYLRVTWPDSCLGLPQPDEGCLEALVDGWQVQLRADDRAWQVHTDEFGTQVRSQPRSQ